MFVSVPQLYLPGSSSVGWKGNVCHCFPMLVCLHVVQVQHYPPFWRPRSDFRDFDNGACPDMKITVNVAERNPDKGVSSYFCRLKGKTKSDNKWAWKPSSCVKTSDYVCHVSICPSPCKQIKFISPILPAQNVSDISVELRKIVGFQWALDQWDDTVGCRTLSAHREFRQASPPSIHWHVHVLPDALHSLVLWSGRLVLRGGRRLQHIPTLHSGMKTVTFQHTPK